MARCSLRRKWRLAFTPLPPSMTVVAVTLLAAAQAQSQSPPPDEIVVTADFRRQSVEQLPASVSVLDSAQIQAAGVQHFEELIREVPNLNLSGEGSRARYFQLRGVGELEQYEGSPNPSLGFVVDDIDFSGLGSIGTLFDIERVEVLRGPQGTRYGANALGGLIYMRSMPPTDEQEWRLEATTGGDGARALGAAVGGPINDELGYRASVQRYESDGFRDNVFLHRDDTYNRDELGAHGKLSWRPGDDTTVDFAGLYVDVDNGYDAWAVDNGWRTYSDKPGRDAQRSVAASARVDTDLGGLELVSITGVADTDAVFSFDADWGNAAYWTPYVYDFITTNNRERRTYNQEIRLLSKPGAIANGKGDWLMGVYALDLSESNDHLDFGDDGFSILDNPVVSDYDATNVAVFGQVRLDLNDRLELTAGLRAERRDADYADTAGNRFAPKDDMHGGELALGWRLAQGRSTYLKLARGYKAGGFNVSLAGADFSAIDNFTPDEIQFGPETLTSLEGGWRMTTADHRLHADVDLFYARREHQQIKIPVQLTLGDPSTFLLVTENAERGEHHGLEATLDWRATERVSLSAAVGLLHTEIRKFARFPELEGRAQAHAPDYTFSLGAEYRALSGWWGRADVSGMDGFFYDYSYDIKSPSYALLNVSAGRDFGPWSVKLWGRNVLDKEYFVRGFFFGNRPPDFTPELYTRLGDPRQYGVTFRYRR
jgi:outer membrane receptor protein involved in Fe transport